MYLNAIGVMAGPLQGTAALARELLDPTMAYDPQDWFIDQGERKVSKISAELAALPTALEIFDCRNNRLAMTALSQIFAPVRAAREKYGADRIGVVLGTSTSGIASTENAVPAFEQESRHPPGYHAIHGMLGGLSAFASAYLELSGPSYVVSTACSSGANTFASARRLLALDICDAVVVGGVDSLCELTLRGFGSLEALSAGYCRPFTHSRDGITLGEAAAVFLVSKEPSSLAVEGIGCSSDAHHISAPQPQGRGALAAMSAALEDAGIKPSDIGYLNLHGTGTPLNDAMESIAVNELLGANTPCSSTKCYTGHTLGTAGALELAICAQAMLDDQAMLPPQPWMDDRDTSLAPIGLLDQPFSVAKLRYCLSNSFAFGGSNISLVLGRVDG